MDLVGVSAALGRGCARRPWVTVTMATLVVCAPLFLALADLGTATWYPVLDLAMTEFRVRDVFGAHTPLIGLPGRIGEFPNQGSHPGPLSFYLLAPLYRLLGSTSWALEAATVAIHITADRDSAVDRSAPRRMARRARRRRHARRGDPRLWPAAADPTVESVPTGARLARRAARHLVGAVR